MFTSPCCTSAELPFSCCGSVAALPALTNYNEHVAKKNISRVKLSYGVSFAPLCPLSRVLSDSKLLLSAGLGTCRRASAVTRWAPSLESYVRRVWHYWLLCQLGVY
jgi:hypothetical protein